jgi:DNA-binding NarL/FixJ family response regulator
MIRVVLADDHPVVRQGLIRMLADGGIKVVADVGNAGALMDALGRVEADVVVLDINMPGRSGIEALAEIRKHFPRVGALVLSVHPEEQFAVRAIRAGAAGYLTKDAAPAQLVEAVRALAAGQRYITPAVANALAGALHRSGRPPHDDLSGRELRVLTMIGAGRTVSEIAAELSISVKTVSTYRTRILEKLELKTTAELARYAILERLE